MSSITLSEQAFIEEVLDMRSGYVLDFSDSSFRVFFKRHGIDIHGPQYQAQGTSKAKRLRAFMEREPDPLVGRILAEMLDHYEALCELGRRELSSSSLGRSRAVVIRLSGETVETVSTDKEEFLNEEFEIPNIDRLPVNFAVSEVIQDRLGEAQVCLSAGAHLSVIFQCGSVLEGVLLGAAQHNPKRFNQSRTSPKGKDGKVKLFHEWTLRELIDVAHDIRLIKSDVHEFSHALRDFRNYIHPYQQLASDFSPDEHTAKICFQVLKAALADVAGDR